MVVFRVAAFAFLRLLWYLTISIWALAVFALGMCDFQLVITERQKKINKSKKVSEPSHIIAHLLQNGIARNGDSNGELTTTSDHMDSSATNTN